MAKKSKPKKTGVTSIRQIKECPDCASVNLIYNEEREQIICRECGLIYEPLAPQLESKMDAAHQFIPARTEAAERIMVTLGTEEPKKAKKPKKKARKLKRKAKPKKAKKLKRKAEKKRAVKKAKPKKAKKPVKKKAVKKKPAKKKAVKKAKKPVKKKKTLFGHIKAKLSQR
ncbi:hypothetical protein JW707_00885 [Candidatus Woesearchaeota archaeon]|nr:hypothetical protein [Candidatus Woesearchaeota archaeon]